MNILELVKEFLPKQSAPLYIKAWQKLLNYVKKDSQELVEQDFLEYFMHLKMMKICVVQRYGALFQKSMQLTKLWKVLSFKQYIEG